MLTSKQNPSFRTAAKKITSYTNIKPILGRTSVAKLVYKRPNAIISDIFSFDVKTASEFEKFVRYYTKENRTYFPILSAIRVDTGDFKRDRLLAIAYRYWTNKNLRALTPRKNILRAFIQELPVKPKILSATTLEKSKVLPQGIYYFNIVPYLYAAYYNKLMNPNSFNSIQRAALIGLQLKLIDKFIYGDLLQNDKNKLRAINIPIDIVKYIEFDELSNKSEFNKDEFWKHSAAAALIQLLRKNPDFSLDNTDLVTVSIRFAPDSVRIVPIAIGGHFISYNRLQQLIKDYIQLATADEPIVEKLESLKSSIKRVVLKSLSQQKLNSLARAFKLDSISQVADTISSFIINYAQSNPAIVFELSKINTQTLKEILKEALQEEDVPVESDKLEELVRKVLEVKPPRLVIDTIPEEAEPITATKELGSAHAAKPMLIEEGFRTQIKLFNAVFATQFNTPIVKIRIKPMKLDSVLDTIVDEYTLVFKDRDTGKLIEKKIYLPRLIEGKYFIHNGRKRAVLYQLFQKPVFATKAFEVIIRTVFTTLTIRSKIKAKHRTLTTYIMGKEIPLITVLLANYCDIFKLIKKFGGEAIITTAPPDNVYAIKLDSGEYLALDTTKSSNTAKQLFYGLIVEFGKKTVLPKDSLTNCDFWGNYIARKYSGKYLRTIRQGLELMIDPTTKLVLQAENMPTNTLDLIKYAADLAASGKTDNPVDLKNRRVRTSEAIAQVLFKHLYMALKKYHLDKEFRATKENDIKIEPDFLIKQLTTRALQSQYQIVQDLNPLIETEYFSRITYAGLQGVSDRKVVAELRTVHPSMYGSIDPIDTPDSANVGVVRHLAVDADISSMVGKFVIKPFGAENVNIFSISGSHIPMALHNDGNRVQFANAQFKSDIRIKGSQPPLVMTGYETILPYLASSDYAAKSPCSGTIEDIIDDKYIIVKCNKGPKKIVELKVKGVAEAIGIKQVPLVNKGDKVEEGQVIAADEKYFHTNMAVYGAGYNAYTLQMPYGFWNYEDAFVVSESFAKKILVSTHIQKIPVLIDKVYRIHKINLEERPDLIGSGEIQVKKSKPLVVLRPTNLKAFKAAVFAVNESSDSNVIIAELKDKNQLKHLQEFLDVSDEDSESLEAVLEEQPESTSTTTDSSIQDEVVTDDLDELADASDSVSAEDESLVESDFTGVTIYPPFDGVIAEIEVYAKDEETLKQYPELYKFWQEKKQKLERLIKDLEANGVDVSPLKQHWVFDNFGKTYQNRPIENVLLIYHIYGEKPAKVGDKLHNRHGNKGTISLILPDDKMPRDLSGKPFDIIMNPTGVISRKNVGQLMEMFITRLTKYVYESQFKPAYDKGDYSRAFKILVDFYDKFYRLDKSHEFAKVGEELLSKLRELSKNKDALLKFLQFIYEHGIIVVAPPTSRVNLRNVEALMKEYGIKPRDYVYIPELGEKSKYPVAYGYVYWFKTVHMVDKKMHARSIGRYSKTMQATAGKSKEGGQRLGELEVFGLIAYDANALLTEFLTLGADDLSAKLTVYNTIINKGKASLLDLRDNPMSRTSRKLRVLLECLHIVEPQD